MEGQTIDVIIRAPRQHIRKWPARSPNEDGADEANVTDGASDRPADETIK